MGSECLQILSDAFIVISTEKDIMAEKSYSWKLLSC